MNAGIVQILTIVHAILGGFALISGAAALIVQKGNRIHKKAGKIFYWAMLVSILLSLTISFSRLPFLFAIGIFSLYFVLTGPRFLRFKRPTRPKAIDYLIVAGLLLCSLIMVAWPVFASGKLNIVLMVFGIAGCIFAIRDWRYYNNPEKHQKLWMQMHLGNMVGGYIAATTAFLVVNNILPPAFNWFVPSVIFGAYIAFWNIKLSKKNHG